MTDSPITLPVIFRKQEGEICAYFPTERESNGMIACYARIGQHSYACPTWLRRGKPAKPEEYAGLLAELRRIYETHDGEHINLKVIRRAPPRR